MAVTKRKNEIPAWAIIDDVPKNGKAAAHAAPGQQLNLYAGTETDSDAVLIPRDSIEAGTLNARQYFDPAALRELGQSMQADGQLQPILVRPHPRKDGKYEIVAGERRWRAADPKYGDIETLRCRVGNFTDAEVRRISLIENIKREDLRPTEKATQLQELHADVNARLQWADIASAVGKSRQWVNDYVSLLSMAPLVQESVDSGKLSIYHARPLRQLDHAQQVKIAQVAIRENLTSKEVEDGVKAVLGKPPKQPPALPTQGRVIEFPAPRPTLEGVGMAVPVDSAVERHHAITVGHGSIGGTPQAAYQSRQPEIDPADVMLKVMQGAQAVARVLPTLMNAEHLYATELRSMVAQTRAALDAIEEVGTGNGQRMVG